MGAGRFTSLHLERLPDPMIRTLLELRAPDLDEALALRILEHAGGVPLYAVEMVRMLADRARDGDGRDGRDERRTASRRGALPRVEVPDSLHGLVAARIDALPATDRRLLLAAAVLGRRFTLDGLVAIGSEPRPIRERIGRLVERELLSVDSDPASPSDPDAPDDEVSFHDLP